MSQPAAWDLHFCERHVDDDPAHSAPGSNYLLGCPLNIRLRIFAVLNAVRAAPPPQFSGGGMWEAMHGEMAGMYEVRIKSGRWLYRLFCSLERTGTDVGLAGPAIMLIDGRTKPERTEIRKTEYAKIRALYDEMRRRVPRSIVAAEK